MKRNELPKDARFLRKSPTSTHFLEAYKKSNDLSITPIFDLRMVWRNGYKVESAPELFSFEASIINYLNETEKNSYRVIEYDIADRMVVVGYVVDIDNENYLWCFGHRNNKIDNCLIKMD